ncbi:MAG TPA: DUF4167 domain-containing protein [Alphaproteobacteria bacterium]
MRQGSNPKRGRGRNNGRKPSPVRSNIHDSNGPNVRVRGNAYQVMEKYLAMARDAAASGDRIAAENYYQHAEHYFRTLNASGGNGSGDRHHHHHMHTPSDPTAGDDDGGDEEMSGNTTTGNRHNAIDPRQMAAQNAARSAEQPRIDPSQAEQPHTGMAAADAPQPFEARGQGEHEPRRRGPNGRRRPNLDGQRHAAPARDPRSISPASPAEAASAEGDPAESEKPS